jgi:hypothetical protein
VNMIFSITKHALPIVRLSVDIEGCQPRPLHH